VTHVVSAGAVQVVVVTVVKDTLVNVVAGEERGH
jgi:hypothetical protein